ncbi:hypothetical protein B0H10DRAFT_2215196 [Mycena sp. CBHHK59/15]|nr:hypothetical protein B0H10DRAFT_2215196 [Mycena sp. CBHHK59/15]
MELLVLASAKRKVAQIKLNDNIDAWYAERAEAMLQMAKDHSRPVKYIRALMCNSTQFKATRVVNIHNAIIHDRAVKSKEGAGNHPEVLCNLQEAYQDDIDDGMIHDMDPAEREHLINQLTEHRWLKRRGARATNRSAAMDGLGTTNFIRDAILDLYERTGIREQNDSTNIRKDITKLSLDGLHKSLSRSTQCSSYHFTDKATNNKNTRMSWVEYNVDIHQGLQVELAGWPADITMHSPAKMTTMDELHRIRNTFVTGSIHWMNMTKSQLVTLSVELAARHAANGGLLKPARKERSDKGKKPVGSTGNEDKEDEEDKDEDEDEDEENKDEEDEEEDDAGTIGGPTPAATTPTAPNTATPTATPAAATTATTAATSKKRKTPSAAMTDDTPPLRRHARSAMTRARRERCWLWRQVIAPPTKKPRKERSDKGKKCTA